MPFDTGGIEVELELDPPQPAIANNPINPMTAGRNFIGAP
jgi:hypothetical protein